MTQPISYADAGVSIDNANRAVAKIREYARSTFNERTLTEIGSFGGMFAGAFPNMAEPILVASADGVGTKLKLAFDTGIHNTVGADLVNHCVNDIAVQGAEPLYFLDYIGIGKLRSPLYEEVLSGIADACVAAGKPLVWGSVLGFAAQVAVFWDAAPGDEGVQLRDVFPEPPAAGTVPSCAEAGVVGALCAQAGSVMAMEAIKLITGIGRPLLGRVLVIDALAGRWDQVEIRRSSRRPTAPAPVPVPAPPDACGSAVSTTVSLPEAGTMFLLDVRGPDEFAAQRVPGSVNIPLPDLLEGALDGVPNDEPILVICRSGQRAEVAAASLDARGYRDVRVLAGGLLALASESVPAQSPR